MDCLDPWSDAYAAAAIGGYFLLVLIIPMHLGGLASHRLRTIAPRDTRYTAYKGIALASPISVCAVLAAKEGYSATAAIWWMVGNAYLTAALSFFSGANASRGNPPQILSYVGVTLALLSHVLFLAARFPLPLGLFVALAFSIGAGSARDVDNALPEEFIRGHGGFVAAAMLGALLLQNNGPATI